MSHVNYYNTFIKIEEYPTKNFRKIRQSAIYESCKLL